MSYVSLLTTQNHIFHSYYVKGNKFSFLGRSGQKQYAFLEPWLVHLVQNVKVHFQMPSIEICTLTFCNTFLDHMIEFQIYVHINNIIA